MADKKYQIVVIGEGSVGKSSLILRFVKGEFNVEYNPTIEETYESEISLDDGTKVTVTINDTAGQEEYVSLREQYYLKGDGFVLVYSIDNKISFISLKTNYDNILKVRGGKKTPCILAGNKCDLESQRQVAMTEVEELAKQWGIKYLETSAQDNINTTELFKSIAQTIKEVQAEEEAQRKQEQAAAPVEAAPAQDAKPPKKKGKCALL